MQNVGTRSRVEHSLRMRLVCSVALLIIVAVAGARAAAIPKEQDLGPGALLTPVAFCFLAAAWCLFDGRVRGKPPARIGLMGIVLAAPIGLPIYCLWSRGIRGVLLLLGSALALSIAALVGVATVSLALRAAHR